MWGVEQDLVVMADDRRRRRRRDFSDCSDLEIGSGEVGQSCRLGCEVQVEMGSGLWSVSLFSLTEVAGASKLGLREGDSNPVLAHEAGSCPSSEESSSS